MKKFNCPKCGKELVRLEPYEEGKFEYWCDKCNIDIAIENNDADTHRKFLYIMYFDQEFHMEMFDTKTAARTFMVQEIFKLYHMNGVNDFLEKDMTPQTMTRELELLVPDAYFFEVIGWMSGTQGTTPEGYSFSSIIAPYDPSSNTFYVLHEPLDFPPFIDDDEKMHDFFLLDKQNFLSSYSYLSEKEYEATNAIVQKAFRVHSEKYYDDWKDELNQSEHLVKAFTYRMYGNGWEEVYSISNSNDNSVTRAFVDSNFIRYVIKYKRNERNSLVPVEIINIAKEVK